MAQETSALEGAQSKHPKIGVNLFWDDLRIGLQTLAAGVGVLFVGAALTPYAMSSFLVAVVTLIGGIVTLLGTKICCSVPEETGASWIAFGALQFVALGMIGLALSWLLPQAIPLIVFQVAAVLAALGHVLVAVVVNSAARYLNLAFLSLCTMMYAAAAVIVSLLFVVLALTGLMIDWRTFVNVVTFIMAAFLSHNAYHLAQAIRRGQQGLPLEVTNERAPVAEAQQPVHHKDRPLVAGRGITETEKATFHSADSAAARAIVVLLTGVFSIGLILYTIVAVVASF